MKQIKDNVYLFESTKSARAFLIKFADHCVIIDTGLPGKGKKMLAELATSDIEASSVTDILITHHDTDHIGSAAYLQNATGAKVWLHAADIAHNLGKQQRPPVKALMGVFIKPAVPDIQGSITTDGTIIPEIMAIQTPGHTPGHTVYMYQNILFSGDAVRVSKNGGLKLLPSLLTADRQAASESLLKIEQLPYVLICPSHQKPVTS